MITINQQREENFQEYLRLLQDPNYVEVTFDYESGGVSAIHREHKFDSRVGPFGIKKGEYEKNAVTILRNRGHLITLESELAPNGVKTPDGWIDGLIMDIKSTDNNGKWAIKKKFHNAAKQGSECVILYFHKKELYSKERIDDGWDKFLEDIDSQRYFNTIKKVVCIVEDKEIEWIVPK
jgi:hypothetical protein